MGLQPTGESTLGMPWDESFGLRGIQSTIPRKVGRNLSVSPTFLLSFSLND